MSKLLTAPVDFLDQYQGYIIGVAALAGILFLNQLIYRCRWKSYPSREEYLAAHPACRRRASYAIPAVGRQREVE